jgi:hypothetical protein
VRIQARAGMSNQCIPDPFDSKGNINIDCDSRNTGK